MRAMFNTSFDIVLVASSPPPSILIDPRGSSSSAEPASPPISLQCLSPLVRHGARHRPPSLPLAVGSAASTPNRSLCRIVRSGTSMGE